MRASPLSPAAIVVDSRKDGSHECYERHKGVNIRFDFSGKVVVVTGAARGIGRVIAHRFSEAGAAVVAADREESGLVETCVDLPTERMAAVVADIASES